MKIPHLKKVLIVLSSIVPLFMNGNVFANDRDFRERIEGYLEDNTGYRINSDDFRLFKYKGISFYYDKDADDIRKYLEIIRQTVDVMEKKISNDDIWDVYGDYPIFIDEDYGSKITRGARASYGRDIIYIYGTKLKLTKNDFSPAIPHELGHFVRRKLDKKDGRSTRQGWLMGVMDDYYDTFEDQRRDDEHGSSSEYFSNVTEAYLYWSNESDPEDASELKRKSPTLYNFIDTLYNPRRIQAAVSAVSGPIKNSTSSSSSGRSISDSDFESGWDDWKDLSSSSDATRVNSSKSPSGNDSIRLKDNSGYKSRIESKPFDLENYKSVTISFEVRGYDHESRNETFTLSFYDGSNWMDLKTYYPRGENFNDRSDTKISHTIRSSQYRFDDNSKFRFESDGTSSNGDMIYLDEIIITGSN